MPYIQRNEANEVIGVFAQLQPGYAEEWLDDGAPELIVQPKEVRIAALQAAYDTDLEKLNKAWLAALIADGVGEATRQAAIKQQMSDLEAQLEIDILTIIMEE